MTKPTKISYVHPICPLALIVSPNTNGEFTASVIDHAKHARVIQQSFATEDEAKAAGKHLAEQYALTTVSQAFAELKWNDEIEEAANA